MKRLTLFTCLTLAVIAAYSQKRPLSRRAILKAEVVDSSQRVQFGYLAAVADSGVVILNTQVVFDQSLANAQLNTINYKNLQEVTIRKKGSIGNGIVVGTIAGFAVGALIGVATYKPCDCYFDLGQQGQTITVGILGAIAGGVVGGIIGGKAKKTFIIGGDRNKFRKMKENVLDMAYWRK